MSTINGGGINNLQMLLRRPEAYSFFQALREVEKAHQKMPRIGNASSPQQEAFRIHQPAHLDFAPTTIDSIDVPEHESDPVTIYQRFFGMLGPAGPLPIHWTEVVRNRDRHANDDTLQSFLDMFHHRMAALFYRAWSSAHPIVQRDRPCQDRFAIYIGSLAGLGLRSSRTRDAWPDESKQFFAGHLGSIRRNAEGLLSILNSTLSAPVEIKPFSFRWLVLSKSDTSSIGHQNQVSSVKTNCLGKTAVLGNRVADRRSQFDIQIGPLSYEQYQQLLPGSPSRLRLQAVLHNYSGKSLDAKISPVLRASDVPKSGLGKSACLGRNAWLLSKPSSTDRIDYSYLNSQASLDNRASKGKACA